jgi:hypothetical protein
MVAPKCPSLNRGRDTPSFCPILQVFDSPPLVTYRASDKRFSYILDSLGRWPWPACLFLNTQAASLLEFYVPLMNCFFRRWFGVVHGPKPPLHCHNWLRFGKFQDTEHFLIPCPCHVSSWLPPSGETCKYTTVPSIQKYWRDSVPIDMLLSAVSLLVVAQLSSEVPEGLMNYPVWEFYFCVGVNTSDITCKIPYLVMVLWNQNCAY